MYELPQGYKLKHKPKIIKGKRYNEVYTCIKVPPKYKLTLEDIDYINHECIKPETPIYLKRNTSGGVYINEFDVTKKKIDVKKFVENVPNNFLKIMSKFNEENKSG